MKKFGLFICLIGVFSFSNAQSISENIKLQAETMATAFEDKDYSLLLDYTYPKILEIGGGKDMMLQLVKEAIDQINADGYFIDSVTVGQPGDIFEAGNELHALIVQKVYTHYKAGKIISESSLLAVSKNKGLNWYFLDVKQLTPELTKSIFPDFNNNLIIPEAKAPVFIYNTK